jgi:beta-lactam-binding protein with PASTA domain
VVTGIFAGSLVVTGCAKKVAVPDVTQQDLDQAENQLTGMQLTVKLSGLPSGTTTQGAYVSSQNPAAGQQVPINSAVDLVVVPGVVLPDLTKGSLIDAVNTLQGLGLKLSLIKEPTNNVFSKGHVKLQTPPPSSTPIRRDATVTLTVESPPSLGSVLGFITKDPSYEKLDPKYRSVLDEFLKPTDANAGTTPNPAQSSPPNSAQQPKTGR